MRVCHHKDNGIIKRDVLIGATAIPITGKVLATSVHAFRSWEINGDQGPAGQVCVCVCVKVWIDGWRDGWAESLATIILFYF